MYVIYDWIIVNVKQNKTKQKTKALKFIMNIHPNNRFKSNVENTWHADIYNFKTFKMGEWGRLEKEDKKQIEDQKIKRPEFPEVVR